MRAAGALISFQILFFSEPSNTHSAPGPCTGASCGPGRILRRETQEVSKTGILGLAGLDFAGGRQARSQKSQPLFTQSCLTLCDPRDGGPPGSSIRGISQARIPQ